MSTGFRLFLLILFGFGAIFAYRYRSAELHRWLRAQPVEPLPLDPRLGIASPVDRVLDARVSWAWLLGSARAIEAPAANESGDVGEVNAEEATAPIDEDISLQTADLPVSEDLEAGDAPEASDGDGPGEGELPTPAPEPPGLSGTIEKTYRVESGDSLWKIAARQLGSGKRYREILEWNRELFQRVSPDVLPPGTEIKLRLPAAQENLKAP